MNAKNPVDIVLSFVEKINAHDVEGLVKLMPEEHIFVDSLGKIMRGREQMRRAWTGYFKWFPDYKISIEEAIQKSDIVGLFGKAQGTYCIDGKLLEENKWEIPAAWRAFVKEGLVAEWQVYADNYKTEKMIKGL